MSVQSVVNFHQQYSAPILTEDGPGLVTVECSFKPLCPGCGVTGHDAAITGSVKFSQQKCVTQFRQCLELGCLELGCHPRVHLAELVGNHPEVCGELAHPSCVPADPVVDDLGKCYLAVIATISSAGVPHVTHAPRSSCRSLATLSGVRVWPPCFRLVS